MKLYRQPDGNFRDENGDGWKAVDHHGEVKPGCYLCEVRKGITPYSLTTGTISIDPVHIARGGQGSRPASQSGSRPQTPGHPPPMDSPSKQAFENVLKAAGKYTAGVRTLLKSNLILSRLNFVIKSLGEINSALSMEQTVITA